MNTDPAVVLFGVPVALGIGLWMAHVVQRIRAKRARNRAIEERRQEWRRVNDWRPDADKS